MREDGGTPGFLQAIRTALAIELKIQMGTESIHKREKELITVAFRGLREIPGLHILADNIEDRLGVISFYFDSIHYNLVVKLLSDRYGVQVRGGCVCAGTYGHFLLQVSHDKSKSITDKINNGDLSEKPGWVRLSIHPTMKDSELRLIINALKEIGQNHIQWGKDYSYNKHTNEFHYINEKKRLVDAASWFHLGS